MEPKDANHWPPIPSHETDVQKAARLQDEREAKKISDAIDRNIERDRQENLKRKRKQIKVLLLGQAESGKSTMLKNFQSYFAPKAFQSELLLWRAVIHLNLVRSVNFILGLLSHAGDDTYRYELKDQLRSWRMHLAPLRQAEEILHKCLTGHNVPTVDMSKYEEQDVPRLPDIQIHSTSAWKELVREQLGRPPARRRDGLDDAQQILDACRDQIVSLWSNVNVQRTLRHLGIDLRGQPGFFLDEAERVALASYVPTIEDVLRARLRTGGVEEHKIVIETSFERNSTWAFYDVAGARSQRAAWAPFFDDASAVIFLCPMDGFDLVLAEDPAINRLIDSMRLWKTICESKVLAKTSFILLLNKRDVLEQKLDAGVAFADYIPQFEGRNTVGEVTHYLEQVMTTFHNKHCPRDIKRQVYVYTTCAVDVRMMAQVVAAIRDVIIMNHLESSSLL